MASPLVVFAVPSTALPNLPEFADLVAQVTRPAPVRALIVADEAFPELGILQDALAKVFTAGVSVILPKVPQRFKFPNEMGVLFEEAVKQVPSHNPRGRWMWVEAGNFIPTDAHWVSDLFMAAGGHTVTGLKFPINGPKGPDGHAFAPGVLVISTGYHETTVLFRFAKHQPATLGMFLRGEFGPGSGTFEPLVTRLPDGPEPGERCVAIVGRHIHIATSEELEELSEAEEEDLQEQLEQVAKSVGALPPPKPPKNSTRKPQPDLYPKDS